MFRRRLDMGRNTKSVMTETFRAILRRLRSFAISGSAYDMPTPLLV